MEIFPDLSNIVWVELVLHTRFYDTYSRITSGVSSGLVKTRILLSTEYVSNNIETWGSHNMANWFLTEVLWHFSGGLNSLFNKWCLGNWISKSKRLKLDSCFAWYTKLNSKWPVDLKVRETSRGNRSESSWLWIRFLRDTWKLKWQ